MCPGTRTSTRDVTSIDKQHDGAEHHMILNNTCYISTFCLTKNGKNVSKTVIFYDTRT